MQTFLPYPDFQKTFQCLDYRRLGKQRVEAYQILKTLENDSRWRNHPAVLMWQGFNESLKQYINLAIDEWIKRGFKNNMVKYSISHNIKYPFWLGDEKFHSSHRSNLLRKNPKHYAQFHWNEPNNLSYVWPVQYEKNQLSNK